jgi:putative ABC transport system permease protein
MSTVWKQIASLLSISGAYFMRRPGAALIIVLGIACTVGVFVSMLSMSAGVLRSISEHTDADHAFVLSSSSMELLSSSIPKSDAAIVEDAPPVARDGHGASMSSRVVLVMLRGRTRRDYSSLSIPLSGVDPTYFRLYPDLKLTAGRMFRPGEHELLISESESAQFLGFGVGDHVRIRGEPWSVVGHFTATASAVAPAITDGTTLDLALSSSDFQYVVVRLLSRADFRGLRKVVADGPSVSLQVQTEGDVLRAQSGRLTHSLTTISYFIGIIMAVGASLGAVATMHVLMEARRRDVATLRALGFRIEAISAGLVIEGIVFSVLGAALGCAIAWVLFNGAHAETLGRAIVLAVTPRVAVIGTLWAIAIGLVAGIAAAASGTRRSVVQALQGR